MRFMRHKTVIHAGETEEWSNSDPTASHTITFGTEPANPMPPSTNVTVDSDGARHAVINSTTDSVHSGFVVAASQERVGLPQSPVGVTRFRVTFSHAGIYPYICALHDNLGMKGTVVVLP
jgi:plastocyanin